MSAINFVYNNYLKAYLLRTYHLDPMNVQIYDSNANNMIDPHEVTGTGLPEDTIRKELEYFSSMVKGMDKNAAKTLKAYYGATPKGAQVSDTFISGINNRDTSVFFNLCGPVPAMALAEAMAVNTTITDLSLMFRGIGPEGAKSIARALLVNQTLTDLDLSHCYIGDEGAKYIAQALMKNRSLTYIQLSDNGITDVGKRVLESVNMWRRENNIPEVKIDY